MPAIKIMNSKNLTITNCVSNGYNVFIEADELLDANVTANVVCGPRMLPAVAIQGDTILLIGNGLNYAMFNYLEQISIGFSLDTNNFLSWPFVKTPESNNLFLDDLPKLKESIRFLDNKQNDFAKLKLIVENAKKVLQNSLDQTEIIDKTILLSEIEHYLAIAFSYYHHQINQLPFENWEFISFLKKHSDRLSMVVSLNYDLLIERCLNIAGLNFNRYGVENETIGIPTLKPHGSIDFETTSINIKIKYPITNIIRRNDTPLYSLSDKELFLFRTEVDIVPPTQHSEMEEYQWVKPGYKDIQLSGNKIKKLIIFGVSYWNCDRKEIDLIIDSIYPNAKAIFINGPRDNNENLQDLQNKLTYKLGTKRVKYYSTISDVDENWFFE